MRTKLFVVLAVLVSCVRASAQAIIVPSPIPPLVEDCLLRWNAATAWTCQTLLTGAAGLGANTFSGLQTFNAGMQSTTGTFSSTLGVTGVATFAAVPVFSGGIGTVNGSITGNAGTVTTNANLNGHVTSVGNTTTIAAGVVTNAMLAGSIDLATKVTGTLADARLSANVPLLNAANVFTSTLGVNGGVGLATATTGGKFVQIGPTSPADNSPTSLILIGSNSATNWRIGANGVTGSAFELTPSTVAGGSTFTTPALTMTTTTTTFGLGAAFVFTAAGGNVANALAFANSNAGTQAATRFDLVNDSGGTGTGQFAVTSSGFSTVGALQASVVAIRAKTTATNGLVLTSENTSTGTIKLYSGGTTLRATLQNAGTWTWSAYGAGTIMSDASGNLTSVSDERWKDIQGPFTPGLNAVNSIRPILFKYKATSGLDVQNVYAGFSAQNVLGYIPEAVGKTLDGFYSLNIVPVLAASVTAIQDLTREVDELRAVAKLPVRVRTMPPIVGDDRAINSEKPFDLTDDGMMIARLRMIVAALTPAQRATIVAVLGVPIESASKDRIRTAIRGLNPQQCASANKVSGMTLPCLLGGEN